MTLYSRAVDAGLRLEAAIAADTSDAVLAQGQSLVAALDQTSSQLQLAASILESLGSGTAPSVNVNSTIKAIGAFRSGLARYGPTAFQHAQAETLRDVAIRERHVAERWALSAWRSRVDEIAVHFALANTESLQGSNQLRQRAESRLRMLKKVRDLNPLVDAARLASELSSESITEWLEAIAALDRDLGEVLSDLASARAQQTPSIRAALAQASTPHGLPLKELTDVLLAEIRAAGVEDQLIVRRL